MWASLPSPGPEVCVCCSSLQVLPCRTAGWGRVRGVGEGSTLPEKAYQLRSHVLGAVAVASRDG